jgi:3-oxoadipate enol-lactonase
MPLIERNDVEIYYESRGTGFPLILVVGYGGNSEAWNVLIPGMEKLLTNYRVITLDNRGTGRSSMFEGDLSIKTMADDVAGLMDSLKIPEAHVFGVSMGGMIAQELAINHPAKVRGLILVSTTPGGLTVDAIEGQRQALEKMKWAFAPPPNKSPEALWDELFRLQYYEEFYERNKDRIMSLSRGLMERYPTPLLTLEKQYDAIMRFDSNDRLKSIRSKTLVIHGEDDHLLMPEAARILARAIPNVELRIFKRAGHCVLEERWTEVESLMVDFLKSLDLSGH